MRLLITLAGILLLQACKHPLAIVGEGDIVDANNTGRGCTLEQFQAQDTACTENEVAGNYFVNYKAEPRPGWRFIRWEGPCAPNSDFQHCRLDASKAEVDRWDETYGDVEIRPSTAVFQPITGETGYLVGPGSVVAGVSYETPTEQGVTGLDGSFQYEEGETVRFTIGDTVLGIVAGQAQVTPFELAGSQIITGIRVTWALKNEGPLHEEADSVEVDRFHTAPNPFKEGPDPLHIVTNIAVLLLSLDEDADPQNGIVIRPGVTDLFRGVSLDLHRDWDEFLANWLPHERPGEPVTLRLLLQQANIKRRLGVAHGVVNPAIAMRHLYETLAIDPQIYATCPWDGHSNFDSNCLYDANGNLIWLSLGGTDPAPVESTEALYVGSYEYDAEGNTTQLRETGPANSRPPRESVSRWQYDANGNVILYVVDGSEVRWRYDIYGNLIEFVAFDDDDQGQLKAIESWQYDANGRPLQKTESNYSHGTSYTAIWQYDANGNLTRYYAELADGIVDCLVYDETWQYDAQGNVTRDATHSDCTTNESINWVGHYEYDAKGYLLSYVLDLDNGWGSAGNWQYDENGKLTRHEENGWRIEDVLESWWYDENNNVTRHELYDNDDGTLVGYESREYGANGELIRVEYDTIADGELINFTTWQYDASGNLIRLEEDRGDGRIRFEKWLYDDDGNLASSEASGDSPGEVTSTQYQTAGWWYIFSEPVEGPLYRRWVYPLSRG